MEPLSRARVIFDEIRRASAPFDFLNGYIRNAIPESEWLDFKCGCEQEPKRRGDGLRDETLKRIWSEALAGFANTAGGVLVWGIDCRTNEETGIDCACASAPAPKADELKARLIALQFPATEPPVQGIEIEAFSDAAGSGFVVCFVPASAVRPHRAEWAGRRYVIRAGDRFFDAPVSHLRNMFFPHSAALLVPYLSGEQDGGDYVFSVHLENAGTASAVEPFLIVELSERCRMASADSNSGFTHTGHDKKHYRFTGAATLHPGIGVLLAHFRFQAGDIQEREIAFTFKLFARDCEPHSVTIIAYRDEVAWGMKIVRLTGPRRSLAITG